MVGSNLVPFIRTEQVNTGVSVDMWDKPDQVMPMIDRNGTIIAKL